MSATVIDEKLQTTLPADVCRAAGLGTSDQVDWRFEDGEIRGRKLKPPAGTVQTVRPVLYKGLWLLPGDVDADRLAEEIQMGREERDARLLG
jgi:hypothetical protein